MTALDADPDVLATAGWECGYAYPDRRGDPSDPHPAAGWYPVQVPGTAAGALVQAGEELAMMRDYDRYEWWFKCSFTAEPGPHDLRLGGLATLADVWLNGRHLLHSENMFLHHELDGLELEQDNFLVLRFSPLADAIGGRRPRPRWRSARVHTQNMRWVRTTLLGRLPGWAHSPAPVGPWREVSLVPSAGVHVRRTSVHTSVTTDDQGVDTGFVDLELEVRGAASGAAVTLRVGETAVDCVLTAGGDGWQQLRVEAEVPDVERWWPHTHGSPVLYAVQLDVESTTHHLGRVGFRTVELDRSDGAFTFVVNGVPIFARGTNWAPADLIGFQGGDARQRQRVELLKRGNHNMVRVPGNGVYEDDAFLDLLDESGILLWQDCMFAFMDYPDDPQLSVSVEAEVGQLFRRLQGRPCLALVCGGADTEEQAAYHGVRREDWSSPIASATIPTVLERLLPGTHYLRATPGDSPLPTATNTGVCHYLSVPAYQRSLQDFRTADVRFAAESMPLPTPPEPLPLKLEPIVRAGWGLTPDPRRQAVHRDSENVAWDMADTMVPYLESIFGVDELALRQHEPDRLPLLQTALSVWLFEVGLMEWRRHSSPCAGALTLYGVDPVWGPGLGMLDSLGRPKATWHAMRRAMAPIALLLTDEGFSGLGVHAVNDTDREVVGLIRLDLFVDGERLLESDQVDVVVPARGGTTIDTTAMFDGFRDLSWAYRFGPPAADVVRVSLLDESGTTLATVVHLPGGPARPREADIGLSGELVSREGSWVARVRTTRFAQWTAVHVPGWRVDDSWFHLLPGTEVELTLRPEDGTSTPPSGRVTALNSERGCQLSRHDPEPN